VLFQQNQGAVNPILYKLYIRGYLLFALKGRVISITTSKVYIDVLDEDNTIFTAEVSKRDVKTPLKVNDFVELIGEVFFHVKRTEDVPEVIQLLSYKEIAKVLKRSKKK